MKGKGNILSFIPLSAAISGDIVVVVTVPFPGDHRANLDGLKEPKERRRERMEEINNG